MLWVIVQIATPLWGAAGFTGAARGAAQAAANTSTALRVARAIAIIVAEHGAGTTRLALLRQVGQLVILVGATSTEER